MPASTFYVSYANCCWRSSRARTLSWAPYLNNYRKVDSRGFKLKVLLLKEDYAGQHFLRELRELLLAFEPCSNPLLGTNQTVVRLFPQKTVRTPS